MNNVFPIELANQFISHVLTLSSVELEEKEMELAKIKILNIETIPEIHPMEFIMRFAIGFISVWKKNKATSLSSREVCLITKSAWQQKDEYLKKLAKKRKTLSYHHILLWGRKEAEHLV
ncbi:MAG: hypothetical protein ACP6IQ_02525 [Candidatus Njordarchaeia archaeon]